MRMTTLEDETTLGISVTPGSTINIAEYDKYGKYDNSTLGNEPASAIRSKSG